MKITINTMGFQDTMETTTEGTDIVLWHTHDGKDVKVSTFDGMCWDIVDVQKYAMNYIGNFYEDGSYEIIDDALPVKRSLNSKQKWVRDMYLDWVNNFLTIEKFCEHYDFSLHFAIELINEGRHFLETGRDETV